MFEIFSNTYVFDPSLCVETDRMVEKKHISANLSLRAN